MNRLFCPTEKKHNEISKKKQQDSRAKPTLRRRKHPKLEKTHSGIFCVDLWDNNRSVGFAHENSPLSRSAGEGWGEDGSCPLCCISASHPHPNLPPLDGGRDQVAVTEKGRLKNLSQVFRRPCVFDGFDDGNLERNCFSQNFTCQVFGRQVGFALQRPFDADGRVVPNQ